MNGIYEKGRVDISTIYQSCTPVYVTSQWNMDPLKMYILLKKGDIPAFLVSVQECNYLTTPNVPNSLIPLICRSVPPSQLPPPCCGFQARSQNVTPLYIAAQSGHVEVVVTLLFARAESNKCTETWLKNSRKKTAIGGKHMKTVNIPPKQEVERTSFGSKVVIDMDLEGLLYQSAKDIASMKNYRLPL